MRFAPRIHCVYAQSVTLDQPFQLESGGTLPKVTVVYETYGQLNDSGDNAILICHAISGDSHVAQHDAAMIPVGGTSWWAGQAGEHQPFFVICPNLLGGCRGTTGPGSLNPATGKPYGPDFPPSHRRHGGTPVGACGSPRHRPARRSHRRLRWRTSDLNSGPRGIRIGCGARWCWPVHRA